MLSNVSVYGQPKAGQKKGPTKITNNVLHEKTKQKQIIVIGSEIIESSVKCFLTAISLYK